MVASRQPASQLLIFERSELLVVPLRENASTAQVAPRGRRPRVGVNGD
jgi:hypothetical protein